MAVKQRKNTIFALAYILLLYCTPLFSEKKKKCVTYEQKQGNAVNAKLPHTGTSHALCHADNKQCADLTTDSKNNQVDNLLYL